LIKDKLLNGHYAAMLQKEYSVFESYQQLNSNDIQYRILTRTIWNFIYANLQWQNINL